MKWCGLEGCCRYVLKRNAKIHARKHETGQTINPNDEDEKVTVPSNPEPTVNLRVRTSVGLNQAPSSNNGEAAEEANVVAPLKIKNLNELMAAATNGAQQDSEEEAEEKS